MIQVIFSASIYITFIDVDLLKTFLMKSMEFNFSHPITGSVRFSFLSQLIPLSHCVKVASIGSNCLKIDTQNFKDGRWKLTLEWVYMGYLYVLDKTFTIEKGHYLVNER